MVWFCMVWSKKAPHGTVPKCIAARTIEPPLSLFPPHTYQQCLIHLHCVLLTYHQCLTHQIFSMSYNPHLPAVSYKHIYPVSYTSSSTSTNLAKTLPYDTPTLTTHTIQHITSHIPAHNTYTYNIYTITQHLHLQHIPSHNIYTYNIYHHTTLLVIML